MLEIKNVTKVYKTAGYTQKALDNVSIKFRESEFVSVLGPSGSGKTTLLNIIGGLDHYTEGDLIINNISTKEYKDANWDSYRNHRVGFVFQSYNLISHQTILRNVELALTLSGVSKSERVKRAKKALKEVGLEAHMRKRPNQLSGGQMQRVAIARALINDPDILLADEPTGALDSKTSTQIMNLLSKIAKNKLVVMVTHNPELANEYSTRLIRLQDGRIISDSNPYNNKKEKAIDEHLESKKNKKTSMSFLTALSLSFNNLLTKKGRTILTSIAGSIGIIGISLILSLSNGFQNYIDKLQEDTLSSYPLTITSETIDFTSLLLSMMEETSPKDVMDGKIVESQQFATMFSNVSTNDLKSFKKYLEQNKKEYEKDVSSVEYNYSVDPVIMTKNKENKLIKVNPNSIFSSMYGGSSVMSSLSSNSSIFSQIPKNNDALNENFEILSGHWPSKYNEMILVLNDKTSISDLILYLIGIRDIDELYDIMSKVMTGESVTINNEPMEFTYDDFLNLEFKVLNAADFYTYNKKYKVYEDMSEDDAFIKKLYEKGETLKIVGIASPKGNSSMLMTTGIGYRADLIEHLIKEASEKDIVKKQIKDAKTDVFSGIKFDEEKKQEMSFEDLISIDQEKLQSAFGVKLSQEDINKLTSGYMKKISSSITTDSTSIYNELNTLFKKIANDMLDDYKKTTNNKMGNVVLLNKSNISTIVNNYLKKDEVSRLFKNLNKKYIIPEDIYLNTYSSLLNGYLNAYIVGYNTSNNQNVENVALIDEVLKTVLDNYINNAAYNVALSTISNKSLEATMQSSILKTVGELTGELVNKVASSFNVDGDKIASAFKFDLSEDELRRFMSAYQKSDDRSQTSNLINLGYQDLAEPSTIKIYFNSFTSKENFLKWLDQYNDEVKEEQKISYADTTGILMSSVKKIVDSVSYVLIAFVSISLIVSSIMIGIITYISVLERTKEIGILRAIGASKRNISNIFNAETFIVGLLAGIIAILFTVIILTPINNIIHHLTNNYDITASLPFVAAIILIILSVLLTLIGGLIPSRIASKKDPVEALRTE